MPSCMHVELTATLLLVYHISGASRSNKFGVMCAGVCPLAASGVLTKFDHDMCHDCFVPSGGQAPPQRKDLLEQIKQRMKQDSQDSFLCPLPNGSLVRLPSLPMLDFES